MTDDDDPIELSANALNALNEFYQEQARLRNDGPDGNVDEDWELSQFWYDDETSSRLARECLRLASECGQNGGRIACVCCPTLFKTLKKMTSISSDGGECKQVNFQSVLFEYDDRFGRYGREFVFYDYRETLDELWARRNDGQDLRNSFDVIVADPPFLSEECVTKVADFVRALKKDENGKIIFCTGMQVEKYVTGAFETGSMKICDNFEPKHRRKLGNEFRCFVNYQDAFLSV